jgi:cytoskeleton protein RodZ
MGPSAPTADRLVGSLRRVADIGSTLREARMRNHIDITEVEARTKIRAKYLRAIENEEWDLLPGPVYIKSFLRTYGDYLGLDSRALIDDFKRRYEHPSDNEMRPIAALGRERERAARGPLLPPWALIGLVLLVLVAALYIVGRNNSPSTPAPPTGARATGPHKARPAAPAHRHPAPAAPTTVKLQLVPTGQVYVCLVEGNGKKLIPGTIYATGQSIPSYTARKLLLTLGNASVRMRANGRLVHVPASANAIRFLVGPTSERQISLSATPTCP